MQSATSAKQKCNENYLRRGQQRGTTASRVIYSNYRNWNEHFLSRERQRAPRYFCKRVFAWQCRPFCFHPPVTRFYIRLCAHIYKTFLLPFSPLQNFHPISQACHFLAKFVSVYGAKRNTQPRLCVPTMTRPTSMVSRLPVLCMQTENVTSTTAQWPVRGTVNFKNDQSEATTCHWYASSFQFVDALRHRRSLTFYYSWNASNVMFQFQFDNFTFL